MTDTIINLDQFDLNKAATDEEAMLRYSRAIRIQKITSDSVASWVHSHAKKVNDPAKPLLAAKRFHEWAQKMVTYITSDAAGEWKMPVKQMDLKGSSAFAQAYRKVHDAMIHGADLTSSDYDTVSKCGKFASEKNKELESKMEQDRIKMQIEEYRKQGLVEEADELAAHLSVIQGSKPAEPLVPTPFKDPGENATVKYINDQVAQITALMYQLENEPVLLAEMIDAFKSKIEAQISRAKSQASAKAAELAAANA